MSSLSRAKHAKPAFHPTRTLLSTGLTAVLLPLCLAAPFAAASPAAAAPLAPATAASGKMHATMRISGPQGAVAPGHHAIGVRLLADGRYYPNRIVRIQKTTSAGWVQIGRMLTDPNGLARGAFPLTASTRIRAVYDGGATSTTGVSPEIAVTVARPRVAPAASFRARAVQVAAAQIGKPYRYGATGPDSFDCSGLVGYAFRAVGKSLPRTSGAIRNATVPVSRAAAVPGDLIWSPGHIGIYAGNGRMIDAPRSGLNVSLRPIYARSYEVRRVR